MRISGILFAALALLCGRIHGEAPVVIESVSKPTSFVAVSGGVRAPQRLPWTAKLTITSAISAAGGIDDFGERKGVKLIRDKKIVGVFALKDLVANPAHEVKLLPGDQIIVPGS